MHSMAHARALDHRPSRGSRNAAAVDKLIRSDRTQTHHKRDFAVPEHFETQKPSRASTVGPKDKAALGRTLSQVQVPDDRRVGGSNSNEAEDLESVGSSPTPPADPAPQIKASKPSRSPRRSPRVPTEIRTRSDSVSAVDLRESFPTDGDGCRVTDARGRRSPTRRGNTTRAATASAATRPGRDSAPDDLTPCRRGESSAAKPQNAEIHGGDDDDDDGDGGGCPTRYVRQDFPLPVDVPYPAKWRCFGRRPPAILEYRPLGDARTRNVRPAGKQSYDRRADERRRLDGGIFEGDVWDDNYGLAKPVAGRWAEEVPYGTPRVIRTGDVDPWFEPARGDLIIINPAQNYYRAMKSGYVMSLREPRHSFGVGDLVLRLGKFNPRGQYIPFGNLEMYIFTPSRQWRFLGRQPYLVLDFNYHNLDYESPGKYLAIGTFLTDSFVPRRGDVIIRGGAWAENYPNKHRRFHTSVRYWRPNMDFMPNDMLLRPYVDMGRCGKPGTFYWGAAELYSYSGKGLAWAYWGRDHHVFDTPFPAGDREHIKTGHHKDEVGYYGSDNYEQARA